jgi:hypothetical protein
MFGPLADIQLARNPAQTDNFGFVSYGVFLLVDLSKLWMIEDPT